jgi:predicted alpha-1,2-mannosidase
MSLPRFELHWDREYTIDRLVFYDRVRLDEHTAGGTLYFSDGSRIGVTEIPNDGSAKSVSFEPKRVSWIRFVVTDAAGKDVGLSEVEVFEACADETRPVDCVEPRVETTRGRWFFCTPGGLPMGMVAAHAFTRNKNQGGGGYNYNFPDILGISLINDWMVSGPNIMPVSGGIDLAAGMEGWKSSFSHDSEIIQPGYHRFFLDRYGVWVEYTATERVAFFRLSYTRGPEGAVVLDAGSKLGNCTLRNGQFTRLDERRVACSFQMTDRYWGGPQHVDLSCVLEADRPMEFEEPIAGRLLLRFKGVDSSPVLFKVALSYVSEENAAANLAEELPSWDFDATKDAALNRWNEMLGRISVIGGTSDQRKKFYTDLWHVLLGRHKIDDCAGTYPDYTGGIDRRVRQLAKGADGKSIHHMYGSDAVWLTQWNLNILWALAWPEILDDFAACFVEYADNGGLIPRGPCAGGYSFIMTGCPGTSLIVGAFMKGMLTKTDPMHAFEMMKRNHLPGGMMSFGRDDDLRFYIENGYCPDNAGKTLEWAFQDWGLSRMAKRLGLEEDALEFERRSHGWEKLYNPEGGLVFPRRADGSWLHTDPLNWAGWIEANSSQGTWSVSHDLSRLVELMGGKDAFCDRLDEAFRKAQDDDFVFGYSGGTISYANQPACSDAHVFAYGGKPWLTQYWVRRVQEQAYGAVAPDWGYGGHDEDQGQMGGVSALMSIGLFSVTGAESDRPHYDITSPVYDEIRIQLNPDYCSGREFVIKTYGNSRDNCYIQRARLDGRKWIWSQIRYGDIAKGGRLELWLGPKPKTSWGAHFRD